MKRLRRNHLCGRCGCRSADHDGMPHLGAKGRCRKCECEVFE